MERGAPPPFQDAEGGSRFFRQIEMFADKRPAATQQNRRRQKVSKGPPPRSVAQRKPDPKGDYPHKDNLLPRKAGGGGGRGF